MMTKILTLAVLLAVVYPAAAQSSYSTDEGLNLRYSERTESFHEVNAPQGSFENSNLHDATIRVTFVAPDSAHASYEALQIRNAGAQGVLEPDTSPVLGEEFVLYFPSDGDVETLSTPAFPASFDEVTNLALQFQDFFVALPDDELAQGVSWTVSDETGSIDEVLTETQSTFEVVGDTTLYGHEALVIDYRTDLTLSSEGEGPAPNITVKFSSTGVETGQIYFATETGIFVGRDRSAELSGETELVGAPQPVTLSHKRTYESSIKLLQ